MLLAIVFASSFVLFGVGTGFGGLQDILDTGAESKCTALCGRACKTVGESPRIIVSMCIPPFVLPLAEIPEP